MTKKHFKAIAEILQEHEPQLPSSSYSQSKAHDDWESLCVDLADYFITENPRFDRQRFYDACYGLK